MRIVALLRHLVYLTEFFIRAKWLQITIKEPVKRRKAACKNTSRSARKFLKAFNITLTIINPEILKELKDKNYLAVSNHVSYTDIILLASLESFSFITSVEMGKNFFLGNITRLGGSLFTNRKNPVGLKQEIENFSRAIKDGNKVVLFAEGTSTDGRAIRQFKSSLFQVALSADSPILPICIKYNTIDGIPIDDSNRDMVCWYGDMTFVPHFMKLLNRQISAEITFLEPVYEVTGKTRQQLSESVYEQIHDCYQTADTEKA